MKPRALILLSLLIALVVGGWVTWPLARNFHEGMPSSHRPEAGGPRYMIPGDHIQFLFQLWMFADAMAGKTPLFYHVYEFNQGDDAARYDPGTYYFPLGVLYAFGHAMGGRAVGWNLMLFISAWIAYAMTWVLARRFCASLLTAAVAALPALTLPYFWACCLGGSPTGPGMLWVPVAFYGVDKAVRERRVWGAILAGVALFVSPWADLHVFFFLFLSIPVWGLLCWGADVWLGDGRVPGRQRPTLLQRAIPLLPLLVLMGASYLQTVLVKRSMSGAVTQGIRKIDETRIYAPTWDGWVAWDPASRHNQIYLGIVLLAVLVAGLALMLWDLRARRAAWRRLAVYGGMLLAIGGVALLALGPNIPRDPHHQVWNLLQRLLPPYRMIRQPAKIYCILAPLLSVALAMAIDRIAGLFTARRLAMAATLGLGALVAWDYGRRIEPTLCLLDADQGAYRAIAEDAARRGRENRALSIPIWPGDSHWNSLTEYYATLYRTKMLNGYRPTLRKQYLDDVFSRLAPMNMGYITDDRLDALLGRQIGYLVLQEDAFPEKVSAFAVSHTLRELLRQPRLQFLQRDGANWAFRILAPGEAGSGNPVPGHEPEVLLGGRAWRAAACVSTAALVRSEVSTGQAYARLQEPGDRVVLPSRQLYDVGGLRYVAAVRGTGTLVGTFDLGPGNGTQAVSAAVGPEWRWVELPVPAFRGIYDVQLALSAEHGIVDVDRVTLVGGAWAWLDPGQQVRLPASAFFRAGYSDVQAGTVHLEASRTPATAVFYAPYLPLQPGEYRLGVDFTSPAGSGVVLGAAAVCLPGGAPLARAPLVAGTPLDVDIRQSACLPLRFEITYTREADLTIRAVTLRRVR